MLQQAGLAHAALLPLAALIVEPVQLALAGIWEGTGDGRQGWGSLRGQEAGSLAQGGWQRLAAAATAPDPPPSCHSRVEERGLILLARADLHLIQLHHWLELRVALLLRSCLIVLTAFAARRLAAGLRFDHAREAAKAGACKGGVRTEDGRLRREMES